MFATALGEILGHTTIVTKQRYGRLSDDMVRREAERLARFTGEFGSRNGSNEATLTTVAALSALVRQRI
jgi:hypothetical protein